MIDIPYIYKLFDNTGHNLEDITGHSDAFNGELFKLLYISVDPSDIAREVPSMVDFHSPFSVAGFPRKIRLIYYTLIDGKPVYASSYGNVAFDDQYISRPTIDPTKLVNTVSDDDTDYYIIRISSTPNIIITDSVRDRFSEIYTVNDIKYTLTSPGNSLTDNSFYAYLTIPSDLDPSIKENGFDLTPRLSISDYSVSQLSETYYRFVITPASGVRSMNLKIVFANIK
jgi:hypothetical protein